jgi:hypothetical protein
MAVWQTPFGSSLDGILKHHSKKLKFQKKKQLWGRYDQHQTGFSGINQSSTVRRAAGKSRQQHSR